MLDSLWKYLIPAVAAILVIIFIAVSAFEVGKSEEKAICQAAQEAAAIKETKKLEVKYAEINKAIPAATASQLKWLQSVAKAHNR